MKFNIHAGHNPDGKVACGAVGIGFESTMNREVVKYLKGMLMELGHTVYDCTVNDGASSSDVLKKIVEKCNSHEVDYDISIHHNASTKKDMIGDGKLMGTCCYIFSQGSKAAPVANRICTEISKLGFPNNGAIEWPGLYVLRNTKSPAILVECCFVDDADDMNLWNAQDIAKAIATGLTGEVPNGNQPTQPLDGPWYKVQTGAFRTEEAASRLSELIYEKFGYEPYIVYEKPYYKVQVGAYKVKEYADKMCDVIKQGGFEAYVKTYQNKV